MGLTRILKTALIATEIWDGCSRPPFEATALEADRSEYFELAVMVVETGQRGGRMEAGQGQKGVLLKADQGFLASDDRMVRNDAVEGPHQVLA